MAIRDANAAKKHMDSWIAGGQRLIDHHVERWREVMANVLVTPYSDESTSTSNPYGKGRERDVRRLVLKDPESSQVAETFRASLMGTLFSDSECKYVTAEPVGYEDVLKAKTTTRLLRYVFNMSGVYRTLSEAVLDLSMFGTAVLETPWCIEERDVVVREVRAQGQAEYDEEYRDTVVAYDDVEINQIDLMDWYPDVEETRLEKMRGAAKGFRITPSRLRALADPDDEDSLYDRESVEKAIHACKQAALDKQEQRKRDVRHRRDAARFDFDEDFTELKGYEYWGEVSFKPKDGITRRVITMVNGIIVRNEPWPLTDPDLPFHVLVINPVKGRHYGKAPAEVIRYTQDFADAMLMLIAEATVRQVHPPIAIDLSKDIDPSALRAWEPDTIVGVDGETRGAIETIQYGANVFQGTQFQQNLKAQMREGSGALGPTQGLGLGVNRASGTEAANTFQRAMVPIEAVAQLLEKDGLPQLARGILRRYQQFLDNTEDLIVRVGAQPESVWIGDIMGDFDIQFVGTRNAVSVQMKMQAFDRLIAMMQVMPQAFQRVDMIKVLQQVFGEFLNFPEVAADLGQPEAEQENMQQNAQAMLLQQLMGGQQGSGAAQLQTPGMSAAQAAGNVISEE
jgi:hypothetical protein